MNYIVVTNTYRRSSQLVSRSLNAALAQKVKPLRVILIDQNEEPLQLPEEITGNELFERQRSGKRGVAGARNGLVIPGGVEWLLFCDDDGFLSEDYSVVLEGLMESFTELEIFAGSIVREDNGEFYTMRHKKRGSLRRFRNSKNLMGSNFVVKRGVFEKLGRFDEDFGVGSYFGSSEETDFCWKAFFGGVKMEYFPELIVYHVPPFQEVFKTGVKKSYIYGVGKGALVSKWIIKEKKFKAFFELGEMVALPFILAIRGVVKLNPGIIGSNIAALAGRGVGLIKGIRYYLFR